MFFVCLIKNILNSEFFLLVLKGQQLVDLVILRIKVVYFLWLVHCLKGIYMKN